MHPIRRLAGASEGQLDRPIVRPSINVPPNRNPSRRASRNDRPDRAPTSRNRPASSVVADGPPPGWKTGTPAIGRPWRSTTPAGDGPQPSDRQRRQRRGFALQRDPVGHRPARSRRPARRRGRSRPSQGGRDLERPRASVRIGPPSSRTRSGITYHDRSARQREPASDPDLDGPPATGSPDVILDRALQPRGASQRERRVVLAVVVAERRDVRAPRRGSRRGRSAARSGASGPARRPRPAHRSSPRADRASRRGSSRPGSRCARSGRAGRPPGRRRPACRRRRGSSGDGRSCGSSDEPMGLIGLVRADQVDDPQPVPRPVGPDHARREEVAQPGRGRDDRGGIGRPCPSSSAPGSAPSRRARRRP